MNDNAVSQMAHYQIIRRNGAVVPFEPEKIAHAMMTAFLAIHRTQGTSEAASGVLSTAAVAFPRTGYLSRVTKSVIARAQGTGRARLPDEVRARQRRRTKHGPRSVRWHWRVYDG